MKKITTIISFCSVMLLQAQNFTGTWNTTFGDVKLVHEGQMVYGDYGTKGIIDAIQTGSTINGKFTNAGKVGEFYFKLASDNKSFTGEWRWQGETTNRGNWTGTLKTDAYPSLKMDKWSGQYEFKSYPNGFTKKLNLQQKGFSLEGKFEDGKSFIGKLSNDLKTISNASLYHGNTLYNITTGIIKSENSEHITVWYGDIKASNTTTSTKFSAKFLKPMTVAEFKSLTGVSTSSTTTYKKNTGGLTMTSQGLNNSKNTTNDIPNNNPVTSISGKYRVTLTRILFSYNCFDEELDDLEVYGTAGIRCYGKSNNSNIEIKALENKPARVFDISKSAPSKVKRISENFSGNTRTYDGILNQWEVYGASKKHTKAKKAFEGELIIDRIREFNIQGDIANSNIEFNIQADISEKDPIANDKFPWSQVSINVNEIELGLEYLLELKIKSHTDFQVAYVGFKIEKY